jgi:hypothetical protein
MNFPKYLFTLQNSAIMVMHKKVHTLSEFRCIKPINYVLLNIPKYLFVLQNTEIMVLHKKAYLFK